MTVTDMVRSRSLVEQSRVLMVEVMSDDRGADEDEDEDDNDDDGDENERSDEEKRHGGAAGMIWDIDEERLHLDTARIYENTIVQLGNRLGDGSLASAQ